MTPSPKLSILIPTRERATYLASSIRTCLLGNSDEFEVLVLDNASVDDTAEVVRAIDDPRLRYARSDKRLSMRDNFERGLELARGTVVGFIGDDDGLFAFTPERVIEIIEQTGVEALAAARAHYAWPDLTSSRSGTGLLPRGTGVEIRNSRAELARLLDDSDYYRLPCIYHGFVRKSLIERVSARQGRFFRSSQVDIYSAIALSLESIRFAFSEAPLVINGGSARSNGASHFGGGTSAERQYWKQEDELGFLPGFEGHATVGSLIVESALRYCEANPGVTLAQIFDSDDVAAAMEQERATRAIRSMPGDMLPLAFEAAKVEIGANGGPTPSRSIATRGFKLMKSFLKTTPIDMRRHGVSNVLQASELMAARLARSQIGFVHAPLEQIRTAMRIAAANRQ